MRGAIKAAIADGLLTFLWIFCASSLGVLTLLTSSALGVAQGLPTLAITTFLVFILLFIFGFIGDLLGGATFNPTATAAFYAAGLGGPDSLISAAIRFPAQAAGAVGGALAILEVMPIQYKHMLQGPSLKVDLQTGAIAEGVLTFAITLAVLIIVIRGPRSPIIKNALLATSTVSLIVAGSGYTGPSMNPANAFGWAYVNNKHNTWEQFYVYWICPFVGAILAAWVFRFLFPPPTTTTNQKKAKKKA
ncbi:Aquaporin SIP1-1 [Castilleja foliolosa]|uniref:Aquaporin SIP1-1 n=1 Tax=Castilleja foliolosa TaxID=1961234 RepID=A0ABD3DIY8_9LAMI